MKGEVSLHVVLTVEDGPMPSVSVKSVNASWRDWNLFPFLKALGARARKPKPTKRKRK